MMTQVHTILTLGPGSEEGPSAKCLHEWRHWFVRGAVVVHRSPSVISGKGGGVGG
jgi:hypothetical protein